MLCYNILRNNKGRISHILQLDTIYAGRVLLTDYLIYLKRENMDTILTVKGFEWSKFIDYIDISIEADLSRVGKNNVYFVHIAYIRQPLFENYHIASHCLDK